MIIKSVEIEKFRAFEHASFALGKRITAISGRNATQKTTVLGMIGQPFTIDSRAKEHISVWIDISISIRYSTTENNPFC